MNLEVDAIAAIYKRTVSADDRRRTSTDWEAGEISSPFLHARKIGKNMASSHDAHASGI